MCMYVYIYIRAVENKYTHISKTLLVLSISTLSKANKMKESKKKERKKEIKHYYKNDKKKKGSIIVS